jgi:trimeric autotransporter adhesin
MKALLFILLLALCISAQAQVAVNAEGSAPDSSAMLDVSSYTKGVLIPRMRQTLRNSIVNPANGLMIYQTDNTPGFYFNSGTGGSPSWMMVGSNACIGHYALNYNTSGDQNTAGYNTGPNASGYSNTTCIGTDALATANDMVRIGNVWVTSIGGQVDWTTLSDARFKENISEDVPGLSFVSLLRPVTYQLNRDEINEFTGISAQREKITEENPGAEFLTGDKYSPVTTGFIAQEVEAAAKSIGFDFSGVDTPKNGNDMYGLRYAEFVVPLVKAVQELAKQNEQLKADNAALEKRLVTVENRLNGK